MPARSAPVSTRQVLLDSAKALLWKVGYEAMSPRRILAESGAGQGSLYHHFPGKAALAAAALEEVAADMTGQMDALFDAEPDPLGAVHRFLDLPFDPLKGCRLGRLANEAAVVDPESADPGLRAPLDRFFAAARARIAGALNAATAAGRLQPGQDPEMLATAVLAAVQGGFVLARIHQDPTPMRQAVAGAHLLLDSVTREPRR